MNKENNQDKGFKDFNILNMTPGSNPFDDGMNMTFDLKDKANVESVEKTNTETTETKETKKEEVPDTKDTTTTETTESTETTEETEQIEETESENTETTEQSEENSLTIFGDYLNDKGLISLEEGKKIESEEDLEGAIKSTINAGIESYKSSKPEDVQKFLEFVENGGNPRDFHRLYYEQMSWSDIDPANESNQELIVREALAMSGWDQEDIEAEITDKKDLGKLGPLAEKFHKKLIAAEAQEKETLIEAQKEHQKKQAELAQKQWEEFKTGFYSKEEINGFKLTPKMKDDLWSFMSKPDRKTGKTGLQIHNETNKDAQYLYAYLAYNNWDISKLEKQVKNKVVSNLADKLKNSGKSSREKVSGGQANNLSGEQKTTNFSSFKTALGKGLV